MGSIMFLLVTDVIWKLAEKIMKVRLKSSRPNADGDWHFIFLLWWYWLWQWWRSKVMHVNITTGRTFSALHSSIEILTISQALKPNVGYCVYQGTVGPWMSWYEILRPNEKADISKMIEMAKLFGKLWWRQNCMKLCNHNSDITHCNKLYWPPCSAVKPSGSQVDLERHFADKRPCNTLFHHFLSCSSFDHKI